MRAAPWERSSGGVGRTLYDNIEYNASGQMTYAELGNGLSTSWTYEPHRRHLDRVDHMEFVSEDDEEKSGESLSTTALEVVEACEQTWGRAAWID